MPSCPATRAASACALVALLSACGGGASSAAPARASESAPTEVRIARVELSSWARELPAVGELAPFERVTVATKVPGRLARLLVDRGDVVHQGQLVAALEAREYELREQQAAAAVGVVRAQLGLAPQAEGAAIDDEVDPLHTAAVRLAQAELERARLERARAQTLTQSGIDSQAAADRAETDFRAAESRLQEAFELVAARRATLAQRRAELAIARAQRNETEIEAPFDGAVGARRSATGAYLAAGDALLELVRTDPLRLVLSVGEREAAQLAAGQSVRARLAGSESEFSGRLVRLAPALDPASRTLTVEAELADPEHLLRAGAFAEARIVVAAAEPVLTLPLAALVSFAGLDKAYVVKAGKSEERRLTLGRREAQRVEVLAGLVAGEDVVLDPGKLGGGAAVRVVP